VPVPADGDPPPARTRGIEETGRLAPALGTSACLSAAAASGCGNQRPVLSCLSSSGQGASHRLRAGHRGGVWSYGGQQVLGNDEIRQVACAGAATRKRCCKSERDRVLRCCACLQERRATSSMTPPARRHTALRTIKPGRRRRGSRWQAGAANDPTSGVSGKQAGVGSGQCSRARGFLARKPSIRCSRSITPSPGSMQPLP